MSTYTSPSATVTVTIPQPSGWVLSNPATGVQVTLSRVALISNAQTNLSIPTSFDVSTTEESAAFWGWGNTFPTVQRGTVQAPVFSIAVTLQGFAEAQTLLGLLGRGTPVVQDTLLLRSDMGDLWWVVIGPTVDYQVLRSPDRTTDPRYVFVLPCTVTAAP